MKVEVILKKEMTYAEALQVLKSPRLGGWNMLIYEPGFHSVPHFKKVAACKECNQVTAPENLKAGICQECHEEIADL